MSKQKATLITLISVSVLLGIVWLSKAKQISSIEPIAFVGSSSSVDTISSSIEPIAFVGSSSSVDPISSFVGFGRYYPITNEVLRVSAHDYVATIDSSTGDWIFRRKVK